MYDITNTTFYTFNKFHYTYEWQNLFYETINCCKVVFDVMLWRGEILWENSINCRKCNVKTVKMLNKMMRLRWTRIMVHSHQLAYFMRTFHLFLNDLCILEVFKKMNLSWFHMWSINVVLIMPCKISFVHQASYLCTYTRQERGHTFTLHI